MRLAMVYALLDRSEVIRPEHLLAALAVWDYVFASCRYIFGRSLGDPVADEILNLLKEKPEGVTRTDISAHFNRHKTKEQTERAIRSLEAFAYARVEMIKTGGRNEERLFAL